MQRVRRVVPLDGHGLAVDKAVELQRRAQAGDLVENLPRFAVGQRGVVQAVDVPVVLEEDLPPVLDQVLLRFVPQDFRLPAIFFCQQVYKRRLKGSFVFKFHGRPPYQTNIFSSRAFLMDWSFSSSRVVRKISCPSV